MVKKIKILYIIMGMGVRDRALETLGEYVDSGVPIPTTAIFDNGRSTREPSYQVKEVREDESGKPYLVKVTPVGQSEKTGRELSFSLSLHRKDRRQVEAS